MVDVGVGSELGNFDVEIDSNSEVEDSMDQQSLNQESDHSINKTEATGIKLRRSHRENAGYHSNRHHLPRSTVQQEVDSGMNIKDTPHRDVEIVSYAPTKNNSDKAIADLSRAHMLLVEMVSKRM